MMSLTRGREDRPICSGTEIPGHARHLYQKLIISVLIRLFLSLRYIFCDFCARVESIFNRSPLFSYMLAGFASKSKPRANKTRGIRIYIGKGASRCFLLSSLKRRHTARGGGKIDKDKRDSQDETINLAEPVGRIRSSL